MSNLAEAEDAIRQLNEFELREHTLKVAIAMSDEDRQRRRNEKQVFMQKKVLLKVTEVALTTQIFL